MNAIETYGKALSKIMDKAFTEQSAALEKAAQAMAGALAENRMVYTFGTGHGHLLSLELFYRAGGLASLCPILDENLMLHKEAAEGSELERIDGKARELIVKYGVKKSDVVVVCSNSGRNAAPVEMAAEARTIGAVAIALTSMRHSSSVSPRNALGKRLYEVADIVLDNFGVPGDAIYEASDGMRAGPTSTAVGAALLQAVVCRVSEILHERGADVEFYKSANIDGGDEWNASLIEKYKPLIPHL